MSPLPHETNLFVIECFEGNDRDERTLSDLITDVFDKRIPEQQHRDWACCMAALHATYLESDMVPSWITIFWNIRLGHLGSQN